MSAPSDEHYMALALELAARGRYSTAPNPCVGCVLVKDDTVVAEGFHRRAGGPHAEVDALTQAGGARAARRPTSPLNPAIIKAAPRPVVRP